MILSENSQRNTGHKLMTAKRDKIKILFVCHGNICRSPMAEFIMKDITEKENESALFLISSCATSTEEIGNPVYPPVRKILSELGIKCDGKRARQMTLNDYSFYDYIVAMDNNNLRNLYRFVGDDKDKKVSLLMDYTDTHREVADPWYTGDFEKTLKDVQKGCKALYQHIKKTNGDRNA